jgi:hypothetical protein
MVVKKSSTYRDGVECAQNELLDLLILIVLHVVVLIILLILVALLDGSLALALLGGLGVNLHVVLLEELLDGLHGGSLASLLALGGVARASGLLVVFGVLVGVLASENAVHLVGVELIIVLLLRVVVVLAHRSAEDLQGGARRKASLALRHGAGVEGSHGDLERGREVGDGGDRDIAAGDLESVDSHGKKRHVVCSVWGCWVEIGGGEEV